MKNKILLFFVFLILINIAFVNAECFGCLENNQCYSLGNISNNRYCDISKNFVLQKADNSECQNNFECLHSYCIDDLCVSQQTLTDLGADMETLAMGQAIYNQGPCTATPGCLNRTSLANATNITGLCVGLSTDFKCFRCNSATPHWDNSTSECKKTRCSSTSPGCWNRTQLNNLTNYFNISEECDSGFICTRCNSNYDWNGSMCLYNPPGTTIITRSTWTTISSWTDSMLTSGSMARIRVKERIEMVYNTNKYFVGVNSMSTSSISLNISSKSSPTTIYVGDEERFDLDQDGKQDLSVRLTEISSNQAVFLIKKITSSTSSSSTTTTTVCEEGETKTKTCPDGTEIETHICESNKFVKTENTCPESPSNSDNLVLIIIVSVIAVLIIIVSIMIIYFWNQRR